MSKETPEEAAERIYDDNWYSYEKYRSGFIKGAKWQAERMYSEEEVLEILAQFVNDEPHITKEWFEQFKKGGNNE